MSTAPIDAAMRFRILAPVFPLIGKKPPLGTAGFKMATQAAGVIRRQFGEYADATGFGLRTGQPLRRGGWLAVGDEDPRHGSAASVDAWEAEHGPLSPTFTVRTGSGGRHRYWSTPEPLNCRTAFLPGWDLKAEGGYVVGPGSLHPNGMVYKVECSVPIAPMPAVLLDLLRPRLVAPPPAEGHDDAPHGSRYVQRAIEAECMALASTPEGARNHTLNRAAFALARFVASGEADPEPVVRALTYAAAEAGLPERRIAPTIRSAFRARGVAA